jgi:hypothetical protein
MALAGMLVKDDNGRKRAGAAGNRQIRGNVPRPASAWRLTGTTAVRLRLIPSGAAPGWCRVEGAGVRSDLP